MLWYSLLIPFILSAIAYRFWSKEFIWQELLLPLGASILFILISYFTLKSVSLHDVEYNGYRIVQARYYESWSTWVEETCSSTTCDSKGQNCVTTYYDCSYCSDHSAYWEAVDEAGHIFEITQTKYNELRQKWSAIPHFYDMNRSISHHYRCGVDGDMYYIDWDGKIETSECSVLEVPFSNIVQCSHSAFRYPTISSKQAREKQLYDYPKKYDFYKQQAILGLDSFNLDKKIQTKFEYLNGFLGPRNKVKIFTLLFKNKSIDIAFQQEAYWSGGNQNEIVVCIGLNDTLGIQWVKPFTWCDNKRVVVDNREDIAELKKFKSDSIYNIYLKNIQFFHYKSFKDFNYLTFEPTSGQILFVYIGTLIVSILSLWWCIKNELTN